MLIVNADDFGRSVSETDSALECFSAGTVTSATAMVFMEDSERAAHLAVRAGIPVGLHLNFCEKFSVDTAPEGVVGAHTKVLRFLNSSKYSLVFYQPLLQAAFAQTFRDQLNEFERLYGKAPTHVDGHRHRHLSANVLFGNVIPAGQKVRRGFDYRPGEKGFAARTFFDLANRSIKRRYRTTDFFFALAQCLEDQKLDKVLALANSSCVEIMCHPANSSEKAVLLGSEFAKRLSNLTLGGFDQVQ